MDRRESFRLAIGLLTQAREMARESGQPAEGLIDEFLGQAFHPIDVPADSALEDLADVVGREVGKAVRQLVGPLLLAYAQLAELYDAGDPEITSADVLRDLALLAETDEIG